MTVPSTATNQPARRLPEIEQLTGLRSAREMVRERTETRRLTLDEVFSTGLPDLDHLLCGGLPRGHVVELTGRGSSGRFSCVLSLLAATTQQGESIALVDLGDQLDPRLATDCGVDLDRLLWTRPRRIEEALSAAEILLAGSFPAIVLDLGIPPLPGGRGRQVWWVRLARAVRRHRSALLVSAPYPVNPGTASVRLEIHPQRARWRGDRSSPHLLSGFELRLDRSKSHLEATPASTRLAFRTVPEWQLYATTPALSPAPSLRPAEERALRLESGREFLPAGDAPRTTPSRPRPRVGSHPHWGYRRPAIPPEVADRALARNGPRR